MLQHAIARRLDYNFETTLGGKSFADLLIKAAKEGFEVRVWYVGLASPEHHLARVKARVKKGGHDIPEADIRRRFDQSRLQLIDLLPHLAELRVYDNSHDADPHQGKAPKPMLLLHWVQSQADGTGTHKPQATVRVPASAQALMATPEWAKPVVMAALKLQSDAQTVPDTEAIKDASTASVRPKRNRPAR